MKEYYTTVRAEVSITFRSERPMTKQEVHEILAECDYEFGTGDEGFGLDDNHSAHICQTQWEDNAITHLNEEMEGA